MKNKIITGHQLFCIMAAGSVGGSLLVISSTVTAVAGNDAWLSTIVAAVFGLGVMLMYYYLGTRFPGMTLIGIAKNVFGKWIGILVSILYVFVFLTTAAEMPWYIGGFFGRHMYETPSYVINLFFVAAIVVAALYGIETIARFSEMILIVVNLIFAFFVLLLLEDIQIENLQPILEKGAAPVIKGAYFLSSYTVFSVVGILMIYPRHVNDVRGAKGFLLKGFVWSSVVTFLTILLSILVLGSNMTARSMFPTLLLASAIEIGETLRMDYFISSIWLLTHYMISVIFFYSGITALSEILGLRDHRVLILPVGLIVLVMSQVVFPSAIYQQNWDTTSYAPLITVFGFILPLFMVFGYWIRKWFKV